jgi:dihydroflavonol-4-reductase
VKVLVTGVTGFTGGHLARTLAARGHQVRGLVRPSSLQKPAVVSLRDAGVTPIAGDLTDGHAVATALEGVDVAYHIAATYREAGQPDRAYHAINVGGTRHVLEGARCARVRRVVHCSTGGVHGHVEHPPANEDAPFRPGDIYQETKLEAETVVREAGSNGGLETTIVRPIGIYGPGDTRFLKMFRGIARGRFPMLGSGDVYYHLTYIDDLVEGFILAGQTAQAAGRTYLIAGPRYTTLNELARLMASALGARPPWLRLPVWPFWLAGALCETVCVPLGIEPPIYRRRVDFYTKSRAFDTTRARAELGYTPRVDLEEGLARTIAWYRAERLL